MLIQTNRLKIKPFSDADKEAMIAMFTDEKIKQTYMLPDLETEEAKTKLFARFVKLSHAKDHFVRGIYREEMLVGFLNDTEIKNDVIELGYVIAPAFWGNGYMTEALLAVIGHLLQNGYREVITGAFASNLASIRVMEKCGMTKMNTNAVIEYREKLHSCVYYAKKQ